ncbi:MAG: hypothetical protein IPL08_18350 [Saprospiraceae bacterium]|nr:hypothetical protein [Saprospiraceae bacterium]
MNSTFDDKKIVVSDHFATEKILALTDEFVTPYLTGAESEFYEKAELLKPRRLLGNYLTYLVKDVEKTYSVIIKKIRINTEYSATVRSTTKMKNADI